MTTETITMNERCQFPKAGGALANPPLSWLLIMVFMSIALTALPSAVERNWEALLIISSIGDLYPEPCGAINSFQSCCSVSGVKMSLVEISKMLIVLEEKGMVVVILFTNRHYSSVHADFFPSGTNAP